MFIATAITNQSQLRRSETRRTLRSYGAVNVSRRVSINISSLRDLCVQETCSKNKKFDLCYAEDAVLAETRRVLVSIRESSALLCVEH